MRNQPFPVAPVADAQVRDLAERLALPLPVARFLWLRQIRTPQQYEDLVALRPLSEPEQLPDMNEAAAHIRSVIARGGRVRVYGDYDADGVTATAVLVRGLVALARPGQVDYYIPNRFDEGYGLHADAVAEAAQAGIDLMVTVDCGSSSPDAAQLASELGVSLVITDHHALPPQLPRAAALVNPERMGVPNRLSGAGVALQLVRALWREEVPDALFAIAAVGTVADIVPLLGDNRQIVRRGIDAIRRGAVDGIAALLAAGGRDAAVVSAQDLGFFVGPHLNASGRMGDPRPAVELLLASTRAEAEPWVAPLTEANALRRKTEREVQDQAWAVVNDGPVPAFVVVGGDGWHHGVIGIVASRLKDALGRPVAVVGWEGEEGRGSARSIDGVHLMHHLSSHRERFLKLGGHRGAAGFSLYRQDLAKLSHELSRDLVSDIGARQYRGAELDGEWDAKDLDGAVLDAWQKLEPFGRGLEAPRLILRGHVVSPRVVGRDQQHLIFHYDSGLKAVAFGRAAWAGTLDDATGLLVRTVGRLRWNTWQGRTTPEWEVEAILGSDPVRDPAPLIRSMPLLEHPGRRIIWVAESTRAARRLVRERGAAFYDWSRPLGELRALEERARRGWVSEVVVNQWRPFPPLLAWADAVIWTCAPMNRQRVANAAALAKVDGAVWMAAPSAAPAAALSKIRRLVPDREGLGRLWTALCRGDSPLLPGRAVFAELDLNPREPRPRRRRLDDSLLYQQARRARTMTESEQEKPFSNPDVG